MESKEAVLTGKALLDKVQANPHMSPQALAAICGYRGPKGRTQLGRFYQNLAHASGLVSESTRQRGRRARFGVKVHTNGQVVVGSNYVTLLGLNPGDPVEISVSRGRLILSAPKADEVDELEAAI